MREQVANLPHHAANYRIVCKPGSAVVCARSMRTSAHGLSWRVARRLVELVAKTSLHGALYLVRRFTHPARRADAAGRFAAALSESLGGAFVKIGQLLSARPDLLPPEIIA